MMHLKLKAEQKQRKNMKMKKEKDFYSKWKEDYKLVEYDQDENFDVLYSVQEI